MRSSGPGLSPTLLGSLVATCVLLACSSYVPATVTWGPTGTISAEPTIFVRATGQAGRIAQSLTEAGLIPADASTGSNYELTVNVGRTRASRPCGPVANVSYVLSQNTGRLLIIKARGAMGTCSPNIFDEMSHRLASFFPQQS